MDRLLADARQAGDVVQQAGLAIGADGLAAGIMERSVEELENL